MTIPEHEGGAESKNRASQALLVPLGLGLLVFSVTAPIGAALYAVAYGESLVRSDAPYIIGAFLGCVAGALGVIHKSIEMLTGRVVWARLSAGSVLVLWLCLLAVLAFQPTEGAEYAGLFAIVSAVAAVCGWPLYRRVFPLWLRIVVLAIGAGYVLMWLAVTNRL